jgi:hypothetical protein
VHVSGIAKLLSTPSVTVKVAAAHALRIALQFALLRPVVQAMPWLLQMLVWTCASGRPRTSSSTPM